MRDTERAPVGRPQASTEEGDETDTTLAGQVLRTLVELARHSPSYAKFFADRAGARLAYQVSAGQIEQLSEDGRAAMQRVYFGMQIALFVEPGLDTNALRALLVRAHG